jgi:membrane protease YdiL (CAAX protease family)
MPIPRRSAVTALIQVAVMFLTGIPAYLWVWRNISGTIADIFQIGVYFYFLAGCLIIGLPHWNIDQLGLNRQGIALSLICGSSIIAVLILGRIALGLPIELPPLTIERVAYDVLYYFGLVGLIEELLFRGLLYRALEELRDARLAIWGTAIAFGIYHVGGQGLIGGFGTALFGLIFALIRWRSGGIVGLIFVHGVYDILAVEGWRNLEVTQAVDRLQSIDRPLALACDIILVGVILYLWKIHPWVMKQVRTND